MPEYLNHRCCMCPQKGSSSRTCPGVPGILHPDPTPCRFVKVYVDRLFTTYFVRAGIGGDTFKAFWRQAGKKKEQGWRCVPWRPTFDAAQADLNAEAKRRGFHEEATCVSS